jgi:hypothetical protein
MHTVAATRSAGTEPASQPASKHSSAGRWCPQRVALCSAFSPLPPTRRDRAVSTRIPSFGETVDYQTHGRTTTERAVEAASAAKHTGGYCCYYDAALRCQQKFVSDGVRQNPVLVDKWRGRASRELFLILAGMPLTQLSMPPGDIALSERHAQSIDGRSVVLIIMTMSL